MFTIQYVDPATRTSRLETLKTRNQAKLIGCLASFENEILAVYEQSTPITKRTRNELITAARSGRVQLTAAAKMFVMEGMRLTTPA